MSDFPFAPSAACQQVKVHCNSLHARANSLLLPSHTKATTDKVQCNCVQQERFNVWGVDSGCTVL